ncbi:MAG: polysaccharide deacetylase [Lachnospiraceae bacterium]|nr:polysaccharide deacetylase [Lachnospiraceae bacterium]
MAGIDAELAARRRRIRLLKKLIIIVPLSTILILFILCIILGVRLYFVTKELRNLRTQIETTAVIEQTDPVEDTVESDSLQLYTTSEVDESERIVDAGLEETPEAEEGIRKVYLTFDDGPSSNTGRILDILAEYDVKATFFVVGKEEEEYQALYNRIVQEGHTLAMHSYSHKYNEIYQSIDSYAADLNKLQEFLYDTTGVWCRYCRFPGGSSNTVSSVDMHDLIAYLDEQDMTYFDWNISSGDAASAYISPEDIIKNCTGNIQDFDKAMILMHDASNKDSTVEALPALIETIQALEDTKIVPITDDTEPIHHISND